MRLAPALGLLAAIAAVCAPRAAIGQVPPTSSLSWSRLPGAEPCIGAPDLARRIEARLGRPALSAPSRADRSVEGRVEARPGGGWRAVLVLARPGGEIVSQRVIETREASCRALDDALVLVIALLVDPDGSPPAPAEPPPRVVIREVVREVRVREPWHVAALTGLEVGRGALPALGASAWLGVAVDPPGVPQAELAGFVTVEESASSDLEGRSAGLRLAGARGAVCPRLAGGRVGLLVCGEARATWLSWHGAGFEQPADGVIFVPEVGVGVRGELVLTGGVQLFAAAAGRVPLRRTEVTYTASAAVGGNPDGEMEVLFRQSPVSVGVGVGLMVEIF